MRRAKVKKKKGEAGPGEFLPGQGLVVLGGGNEYEK